MILDSNRRPNVAVLGSYNASKEECKLASDIGRLLSNYPINLISGGQKGVMYCLCRSAFINREKDKGNSCTIVGLLPSEKFDEGNEYLDLAIPTGGAALQNSIIPLSADIVIGIGGSSGTLIELAFAWRYKKPIGLIGSHGWAYELAGKKLDNRREDFLKHFSTTEKLIDWVCSNLKL